MSVGLDKLKSIGVQKIHEATHIATTHIQAIFHENFEDMHHVQFLGFVSILEREYGVDLSDLKNKGEDYFNTRVKYAKSSQVYKVFTNKKRKSLTAIYLTVALVVFIFFSFVSIRSSIDSSSEAHVVDNSAIESAKKSMNAAVAEANLSMNPSVEQNITAATREQNLTVSQREQNQTIKTQELNVTVPPKDINQTRKVEKQSVVSSFKIVPTYKVWVGYVDLSTSTKSEKVFSDELVLDSGKDWALSFGHGFVSIEIDGIVKKFTQKERLHLLYKNRELKEITFSEYKALGKSTAL